MDMSMAVVTSVASSTVTTVAHATTTVVDTAVTTSTGMGMGGSSGCKLSMLLNWHTIDACFLSSVFHIRSSFTFFLACLGALLLVISLEFLRRIQRQFDQYLRKRNESLQKKAYVLPEEFEEKLLDKATDVEQTKQKISVVVLEQLLRGLIHVAQFSVSYCIMLIFMYNNGYIIISILIGALAGFALFTRDTLSTGDAKKLDDMEKTCC
ncbi:Copper Transporter integral membrane protein that functions in high affinity copper transport [Cadophora gregata]|uniref:Copper Transporter integral membrane protein that functions in high affinity copper transport n=1 Tax=Cadophora gregata TaxID=51156 RepID=UPI0026DD39CF|nr:Copper Transporter integral membrane protein that functions in high affinity copper transport [Cadophora gregata]KAK0109732.1 Copper Transporter integral membrane protein that functions in high affinity copper transport [Cadophora gregata]KAK0110635.1 Copper Transporter integral membrane protein that functions in high affinity copper transport [Cadophora gregata f. sp. sojae]